MTDMHFTIVVSFWDKLALSRSLSLLLSLSTSISLSFLNRHLFVWFNSILAFSLSLSLRYSFSHWLSIHCEMFIFWIYVCIAFSDPCMLTMILRCACRHNGHCVSLILCTYAHVIIFSVKLSSNFCRFCCCLVLNRHYSIHEQDKMWYVCHLCNVMLTFAHLK